MKGKLIWCMIFFSDRYLLVMFIQKSNHIDQIHSFHLQRSFRCNNGIFHQGSGPTLYLSSLSLSLFISSNNHIMIFQWGPQGLPETIAYLQLLGSEVPWFPFTEKTNKKTWSKNAFNHLKWMLKSSCFFTLMRPISPLLVSPSRQSRGWVMWWVRGGHNGKKQVCFKMIYRKKMLFFVF